MAAIAKRFKDAVTDGKGQILEAAGVVLDCGDGVEQVITTLVVPRPIEVDVAVVDDDGNETGETIRDILLIDVAVPLSTVVSDTAEFQAAIDRYAEAYMRGKAIEAMNAPTRIEASAEVLALLSEK